MRIGNRITALALLKAVGLVREAAIIAFSVGQNATGAANCYFLSSQAAMIFNGRGLAGKLLGSGILVAFWLISGEIVPFSLVVFLPFLFWPRINKAAFENSRVVGIVVLSIVFNASVFAEMTIVAIKPLGIEVPNLFGVPFVALYVTIIAGLLLYGLSPSIENIELWDLLLLSGLCAVRIIGFSWVPAGFDWLFLAMMRGVEVFVPQWITLKRIGVANR